MKKIPNKPIQQSGLYMFTRMLFGLNDAAVISFFKFTLVLNTLLFFCTPDNKGPEAV